MTVSHNTEHDAEQNEIRMFPALRVMERQTPPLKYGREPYWRAPVPACSEHVYIPSWNWTSPQDLPEGEAVTVLDVNAAYLSALGMVKIAHSHLRHTGAPGHHPLPRDVKPGYYRITVPHWAWSGTIVHPLGNSARLQTESALYVTAPTLILLLELEAEGHLGLFDILDSWTPDTVTDFLSWSERLRSLRNECLDRIELAQTETAQAAAHARYDAFKQGYSSALSMMLTGERCQTHRPDWSHTVYAAHAANTWRKAWRYTYTGRPLVAMGAVDEISVLSQDLVGVTDLPKPPFRIDPTGRQPGAFKPKRVTFVAPEPQRATDVYLIDDPEGIL